MNHFAFASEPYSVVPDSFYFLERNRTHGDDLHPFGGGHDEFYDFMGMMGRHAARRYRKGGW